MPFLGPPGSLRLLHPGLLSDASPAWPRYPWGQEAFDKARKENKPIFLSGKAPASPGGRGEQRSGGEGKGASHETRGQASSSPAGPPWPAPLLPVPGPFQWDTPPATGAT